MQKIIEFKNIRKSFGKHIVHDGVNLTLFKGEVLSLIGENGCGKTQLMKILLSLVEMDQEKLNHIFLQKHI